MPKSMHQATGRKFFKQFPPNGLFVFKTMSGNERRTLKKIAKVRAVDLRIGKKGLTRTFVEEARKILSRDGMIKFSHSLGREDHNELISRIEFLLSADLVAKVGKTLMAKTASTVKRVSMELGGHAPFIVFDDADLDAAVEGAMANKYRNSGQVCVSANRIYVHESVYDKFAKKMADKSSLLKVADGRETGTQIGPLISMAAVEKVESHVSDAVDKGARVLVGGERDDSAGIQFYKPTVITDINNKMKIYYEETFGPVAPLIKFSSEDDVIKMANDTDYGLAGYFYSRDINKIWRVAEALEYGMVGINAGIISTEVAPFGGVKESGVGREGAAEGIEEYLETKYLCMDGINN